MRRIVVAVAVLVAGASWAQDYPCKSWNITSGCVPGSGTLTAGQCYIADDQYGASFQTCVAAGLDCTACVDFSDETNATCAAPITCAADEIGLTQHAGTDVTADLEEETHASEHQNGGADELSLAGLAVNSDDLTGTEWTDLTDSGATTLHSHAGGGGDIEAVGDCTSGAAFTGACGTTLDVNGSMYIQLDVDDATDGSNEDREFGVIAGDGANYAFGVDELGRAFVTGAAPQFSWTDTTASALDAVARVDSDKWYLQASTSTNGDMVTMDLATGDLTVQDLIRESDANGPTAVNFTTHSDTATDTQVINFQKSRGTGASPTQVNAVNHRAVQFRGTALDNGGTYRPIASIIFQSADAITSTSSPGTIVFNTTPVGAVVASAGMTLDPTGHLEPIAAGTQNLGSSSKYWNEVNAKDFTDRGCLGSFDAGVEMRDGTIVSDTEALLRLEVDPEKETFYGVPMLDYESFPRASYKAAPVAAEDVYEDVTLTDPATGEPTGTERRLRYRAGEKMGEDGIGLTSLISIMIGATRELTLRVRELERENTELRARVAAIEAALNLPTPTARTR